MQGQAAGLLGVYQRNDRVMVQRRPPGQSGRLGSRRRRRGGGSRGGRRRRSRPSAGRPIGRGTATGHPSRRPARLVRPPSPDVLARGRRTTPGGRTAGLAGPGTCRWSGRRSGCKCRGLSPGRPRWPGGCAVLAWPQVNHGRTGARVEIGAGRAGGRAEVGGGKPITSSCLTMTQRWRHVGSGERRRRPRLGGETAGWVLPEVVPVAVDGWSLPDEEFGWEVRVHDVSRLGVGFVTTEPLAVGRAAAGGDRPRAGDAGQGRMRGRLPAGGGRHVPRRGGVHRPRGAPRPAGATTGQGGVNVR